MKFRKHTHLFKKLQEIRGSRLQDRQVVPKRFCRQRPMWCHNKCGVSDDAQEETGDLWRQELVVEGATSGAAIERHSGCIERRMWQLARRLQ